jgi:protein TonB
MPNAAVAPASSQGTAGTPIQTDIGKLVVVYQPDADPYYPSFSKRAGEQGEVVVRLIIDETGVVEEAVLLRSSGFARLDRAAEQIGRRYRFKPYTVNGNPARISTNLLIKFNLKN